MSVATAHPIPADLPADAIGFVRARLDRPDHLAFYRADGTLNTTFPTGSTLDEVRPVLEQAGLTVDAAGVVRS